MKVICRARPDVEPPRQISIMSMVLFWAVCTLPAVAVQTHSLVERHTPLRPTPMSTRWLASGSFIARPGLVATISRCVRPAALRPPLRRDHILSHGVATAIRLCLLAPGGSRNARGALLRLHRTLWHGGDSNSHAGGTSSIIGRDTLLDLPESTTVGPTIKPPITGPEGVTDGKLICVQIRASQGRMGLILKR